MTNKIKSKIIHLAIHPKMHDDLRIMADFYGLTTGEMLRKCISDFYMQIYIRNRVGPYKGAESITLSEKKSEKKSISSQVDCLDTMTDAEATEYLFDLGYNDRNEIGQKFIVKSVIEDVPQLDGGSKETLLRGLFQIYDNDAGSRMCYTMEELKGDVRKFLKKKQ